MRGILGRSERAEQLLAMPRAEIDQKMEAMHTNLGTLIAEHEGIVDSADPRVQAVYERMAAMTRQQEQEPEQAAERPRQCQRVQETTTRQQARRQVVRKNQKEKGEGMDF